MYLPIHISGSIVCFRWQQLWSLQVSTDSIQGARRPSGIFLPSAIFSLMKMQGLKISWRNFPAFYDKYMSSLGKQINATFRLKATRIDKVHFGSKLEFDLPVGNFNYIVIFSLVGVFMLLIASLNYMNMATAGRQTVPRRLD